MSGNRGWGLGAGAGAGAMLNSELSITDCELPSAFCPPLSAFCLLPTAYCIQDSGFRKGKDRIQDSGFGIQEVKDEIPDDSS